ILISDNLVTATNATPVDRAQQQQAAITRFVNVIKPLSIQQSRKIDMQLLRIHLQLLNPAYTLPSRSTPSKSLITGVQPETLSKVEKDLSLRFYLLECSEFTAKHTGENISKWVTDVLTKFFLPGKVVVIVSDNAANMKTASLKMCCDHLSCFAHSINLVVQHSISNSIQSVVNKCKAVVQHFKKKGVLH
uniref:DUF659 domain-containing protein n=1 Tax=Anopheles christyi TaxID=43041 RepID=A0A182K708_9DIPT